ncbi:DNA mismatch repair protein MutS [Pseudalgibacter alginicilyticus]|uniref:DNA mismatch repair protein MutS n=1 Tax=Pseudalgibacter alginicilyticus TaxID=1736674 RepID=A0A0N7HY46_9FLAO|nr:Smr/MutS family protein [Pseudalgibacter alginicilyticus]ALJ04238.1 DNA mismatch repair protein MutS [Pseudalgibacter alginicilyticus]
MKIDFNIGDVVLVLDEDLSGIVTQIKVDEITIETADGFNLQFQAKDLVKHKTQDDLQKEVFLDTNIQSIISEKEQAVKRKQIKTRAKDRYEPTMEVDLHIHQLVKSSRGMSNHDMLTLQLDTARRQLDFAISKRIQKIVFIHGVGEGVLKVELDYLFGRYNNVKFYDANYQKYGLGATEVYIYQNVAPN